MKVAKFYLRLHDRYLNANDEFKAPVILGQRNGDVPAFGFDSQALALAKAEALGLDLGHIRIVRLERDIEETAPPVHP